MRRTAPLLLLLAACEPEPVAQASPAPSVPVAVDFETLAAWAFVSDDVPPEIAALDGMKVEITGFIYPPPNPRNLREFILMKDRGTCCYGPQTQWTHFLEVTIPEPVDPIHYTTEPVTLVGTLRVEPKFFEDKMPDGLYFLTAEAHRK